MQNMYTRTITVKTNSYSPYINQKERTVCVNISTKVSQTVNYNRRRNFECKCLYFLFKAKKLWVLQCTKYKTLHCVIQATYQNIHESKFYCLRRNFKCKTYNNPESINSLRHLNKIRK